MSASSGFLHRLRHTPLRDFLRGRLTARLDWRAHVSEAGLPAEIQACIREVVRHTRLWGSERVDVARELIAHFADGLESGRSPGELAASFGDPAQAARLITRAKKRARPALWHVQRYLGYACLGLMVAYVGLALWFFARSSDIKRNYSRELSAGALATPDSDRALPIYLKVAADLPPMPDALQSAGSGGTRGFLSLRPGDAQWADLQRHFASIAPQLELMRVAAAKRTLGFVLNRDDRAFIEVTNQRAARRNPNAAQSMVPEAEENPWMVGVLLPHLGEMRSWVQHLKMDTIIAAEQRNAGRVFANLQAMLGMSEQVRRPSMLICELVGYALFALATEATLEVLSREPALLSEDQLVRLAHAFGTFDLNVSRLDEVFDSEQAFFEDTLQRMYSDDGRGNGRLTPEGIRLVMQLQNITGNASPASADHGSRAMTMLAGPLAAVTMASRKDVLNEYTSMIDAVRRHARTPLWERPEQSPASIELELKVNQSWSYKLRYLPIALLTPAFDRAAEAHQRVVQRQHAVLAVLGVERFKRRSGSYPASLKDLVPRDLPWVPIDRFDGRPLRILMRDGSPVLYSVGANRTDDGGAWARDSDERTRWRKAVGGGNTKPEGDWVMFPPDSAKR